MKSKVVVYGEAIGKQFNKKSTGKRAVKADVTHVGDAGGHYFGLCNVFSRDVLVALMDVDEDEWVAVESARWVIAKIGTHGSGRLLHVRQVENVHFLWDGVNIIRARKLDGDGIHYSRT